MGNLKEVFGRQGNVVGPFLRVASPAVVEIFGNAGFDYVIIDAEHGPISMETAEHLVRAADYIGISPVIRIRDNDPTLISRALDIGAEGVQVPQVSDRESALAVAKAAHFAPEGERGVCRYTRAAAYSHTDKFKYFKEANEKVVVIIHIEGEEGVRNLDEIIAVEGLDVIFIGPYDLSQSMGVPGDVNNPKVEEKMREIVEKAKKAGLVVGTFVEDVQSAHKWMDLGIQYISYSVDVGIFYQCLKSIAGELKSRG